MPDADRLGVPPDGRTRGSARATGREAGTAATSRYPKEIGEPTTQPLAYDRDAYRLRGPMIRNELRIGVRSGELVVGMLSRGRPTAPSTWLLGS